MKTYKIVFLCLLCSILLTLFANYQRKKLPPVSEIHKYLYFSPEQKNIRKDKIRFEYRDNHYVALPQASYKLFGLIVSHNNIKSLFDSYHDGDSVDIKDICVVWGDNLKTDVYQRLHFNNTSWTCHFRWDNYQDGQDTNMYHISNNHLISSDSEVRKKIKGLNVGDQIYLEGDLVNYYNTKMPGAVRESSLIREDDGCEVIHVDKLKIIKAGNPAWNKIFKFSKYLSYFLVIIFIISFYLETRVKYIK